MSFHKILLMQSVEDVITLRRRQKIESNPAVQGCEFAHCYAVELKSEQKLMRVGQMMESVMAQPFDQDGLTQRLIRQIGEFNPDLLLVHPGFVFRMYTNEVLSALKIVKAQFPNLKFGLLNSEDPLAYINNATKEFFDSDAELQELIEQVSIPRRPLPKIIRVPPDFAQWRSIIWYEGPSLN